MIRPKTFSRFAQAIFYVVAGANHFINPDYYLPVMPPALPAPELLHKLAGAAELLGGLGLLIPRLERAAAWGLIVLLVVIFPANLYVAFEGGAPMGVSATVAWLRLPFQFLFIAWAWWHTRLEKHA